VDTCTTWVRFAAPCVNREIGPSCKLSPAKQINVAEWTQCEYEDYRVRVAALRNWIALHRYSDSASFRAEVRR